MSAPDRQTDAADLRRHATLSHEYLKAAVLTATPEQLQLMLYDGAIRFATRGLEALRAKDREGMFTALERAQLIALELSNGIRREVQPELADRMNALYQFIYRRLVEANLHQDERAIDDALRTLRYERETWLLLIEKIQREAHGGSPDQPSASEPATDDAPSRFCAEA